MEDSWKSSLMTGDQCAICEQPLDEQAVEVEENGRLIQVCGACAIRRTEGRTVGPGDSGDHVARQARNRGAIIEELIEHRRDEESQLQSLSQFIMELADSLVESLDRNERLEKELGDMRGELERAQDALRRAEGQKVAAESPEGQASPHFPPSSPGLALDDSSTFTIEELQEVQRVFNESPFTDKLRSVRRSLGRPIVRLDPVRDEQPQILITVAWDIVWYQFLVNLDPDAADRVSVFGEGMELDELAERFHEATAVLDDQGRVDASELEFELVKEQGEVITDESPEQAALEDATEEIWDKHSSPEFRWDD